MPDDTPQNEETPNLELGNSDDDFETFVRQMMSDDPPASDDEPEPVVTEPEVIPPANTDTIWRFEEDDITIDRERARSLALFDAWLSANPELAEQIAGVTQGQYELVPKDGRGVQPNAPTPVLPPVTPANSTMPEEFDPDDPVQKRLWQELNSNREQLAAASEIITRHEAAIRQTGAETTRALVDRVATEYGEKRQLSADELQQVRSRAAQLNIVSSLASPIDPVTRTPRQVDPVAAVEQALETAYWSIPEFRAKALEGMAKDKVDELRKKAKLNSLGGTSGSVPRKTTKPSNDNERREAMIAEVASVWNGNGN